jgi:hypothetical protein
MFTTTKADLAVHIRVERQSQHQRTPALLLHGFTVEIAVFHEDEATGMPEILLSIYRALSNEAAVLHFLENWALQFLWFRGTDGDLSFLLISVDCGELASVAVERLSLLFPAAAMSREDRGLS